MCSNLVVVGCKMASWWSLKGNSLNQTLCFLFASPNHFGTCWFLVPILWEWLVSKRGPRGGPKITTPSWCPPKPRGLGVGGGLNSNKYAIYKKVYWRVKYRHFWLVASPKRWYLMTWDWDSSFFLSHLLLTCLPFSIDLAWTRSDWNKSLLIKTVKPIKALIKF